MPETSVSYVIVPLDEGISCTLSKTDVRRQGDGRYSRVIVYDGHVDKYSISLWNHHDVKVDTPIYVESEDGVENRALLYLDAMAWQERITALLKGAWQQWLSSTAIRILRTRDHADLFLYPGTGT